MALRISDSAHDCGHRRSHGCLALKEKVTEVDKVLNRPDNARAPRVWSGANGIGSATFNSKDFGQHNQSQQILGELCQFALERLNRLIWLALLIEDFSNELHWSCIELLQIRMS